VRRVRGLLRVIAVVGLGSLAASPFVACGSDAPAGGSAGIGNSDAGAGTQAGAAGAAASGGAHSAGSSTGGAAAGSADGGRAGGASAGESSGGASGKGSGGASFAGHGSGGASSAGSSGLGGANGGHGGGSSGGAGGGSSGAGPTMAGVQAIFDQRCISCHDASKVGLPSYPALPLTASAAYSALVSHPADQTCGGTRVVPFDSTKSYLYHKVNDAAPCSGARMPHKQEVGPAIVLSTAELETIRAWIDGGARQ
jgi:hypothetical protein